MKMVQQRFDFKQKKKNLTETDPSDTKRQLETDHCSRKNVMICFLKDCFRCQNHIII